MKLCHSERFSDQDLLLIDALSFRIASADEESALDWSHVIPNRFSDEEPAFVHSHVIPNRFSDEESAID